MKVFAPPSHRDVIKETHLAAATSLSTASAARVASNVVSVV